MNNKHRILFITILSFLLLAGLLSGCAKSETPEPEATPAGRDQTIESQIIARLEAINPDAVPVFEQATEDMDANNLEEAKAGFEKVLLMAPDFPDAIRRLAEVWLMIGDPYKSIEYAQRALELDSSPYTMIALANALLASGEEDNVAQSLEYARVAANMLPDFPQAQETLLFAAIPNQDFEAARVASDRLIQIDPNYAYGHYFAGLAAAEDGKWEKAEKELLLAKELGIPADQVEIVLANGVRVKARTHRYLRYAFTLFSLWFIFVAIATLVTWILGHKALKSIQKSLDTFTSMENIEEFTISSAYKNSLNFLSILYAISGPFLILASLIGLLVGVALIVVGYIDLLTALLMIIPSLLIIITSLILLLVHNKKRIFYELMRSLAEPLWNLSIDTANQLGAAPINEVYIRPDATFLVEKEETSNKGEEKIILHLGLSALQGMTQAEYCALLADEYGRNLEIDDSWSNFGLCFLADLRNQLIDMKENHYDHFYNPAWLIVRFVFAIYSRIAKAATWQYIINADLVSGSLFGGVHLKDGLIHLLRQKLRYEEFLLPLITAKKAKSQNIRNIYTEKLHITLEDKERLSTLMKRYAHKSDPPFDDYPPLEIRVALLKNIGGDGIFGSSEEPIDKLITNFDVLQVRMTERLRGKKIEKEQPNNH